MSMVGPLVRKVLASLGIGWVTFEGTTGLMDQVRTQVLADWGQTAPTVYDLLTLAGFTTALGIILGAVAVVAGLSALSKLGRILG